MGTEEERTPEILVKVVMSLYEGSKMDAKVGSEFSEELYAEVGIHQDLSCSLCCLQLWWVM